VLLGGLNPRSEVADSHVEQSPEGGAGFVFSAFIWAVRSSLLGSAVCVESVLLANDMRAQALETAHGCVGGAKL
jgi:hypothetical protein